MSENKSADSDHNTEKLMDKAMFQKCPIPREFEPLAHLLKSIPLRAQKALSFSTYDVGLTCIDLTSDYIAVGSSVGTIFLYERQKQSMQRLHSEPKGDVITSIKVQQCLDNLVAVGLQSGTVCIFQLPSNLPGRCRQLRQFKVSSAHKTKVSCLEFSNNGMKLFSGDENGLVCLTELDLDKGECLFSVLLKEDYPVVQLSYNYFTLLVSTRFRTVLCKTSDSNKVLQVGSKDRKCLGNFGACYKEELCKSSDATVYTTRPGFRVWQANIEGVVSSTFMFKDFITNAAPNITLAAPVTPFTSSKIPSDRQFGPLLVYNENQLVTWSENVLYVLNPVDRTLVGCTVDIGPIIGVATHKDEIFILRMGVERRIIRVAVTPEEKPVHVRSKLAGLESTLLSSPLTNLSATKSDNNSDNNSPAQRDSLTINNQKMASEPKKSSSPLHFLPVNLFGKLKKKNPSNIPTNDAGGEDRGQNASDAKNFMPVNDSVDSSYTSEISFLSHETLKAANTSQNEKLDVKTDQQTSVISKPAELPPIVMLNSTDILKLEISDEHEYNVKTVGDVNADSEQEKSAFVPVILKVDGEIREDISVTEKEKMPIGNNIKQEKSIEGKHSFPKIAVEDNIVSYKQREEVFQRITQEAYSDDIVFASSTKLKKGKKKRKPGRPKENEGNDLPDVLTTDIASVHSATSNMSDTPLASPLRSLSASPVPSTNTIYTPNQINVPAMSGQQQPHILKEDLYSALILPEKIQSKVEEEFETNGHSDQLQVVDNSVLPGGQKQTSSMLNTFQNVFNRSPSPKDCSSSSPKSSLLDRVTLRDVSFGGKSPKKQEIDILPVTHKRVDPEFNTEKNKHVNVIDSYTPPVLSIDKVKLENEEMLLKSLQMVEKAEEKAFHRETVHIADDSAKDNKVDNTGFYSTPDSSTDDFYSKFKTDTSYNSLEREQSSEKTANVDVSLPEQQPPEDSDCNISHLWPKISESWMSYATSGNLQSLALSAKHVWYVDKSDNAYCSSLTSPSIMWKKVDQSCTQLAVAPSGNIVWRLHKNAVFAGTKITTRYPWGMKWVSVAQDVTYIAVDETSAWYIKNNGDVMYQNQLSRDRPAFKSHKICGHQAVLIKIACRKRVVWGVTQEQQLLVRKGVSQAIPGGTGWEKLKLVSSDEENLIIVDISFGHDNTAWIMDVLGRIWCKTGVTMNTPEGQGSWWQVSFSEYIMPDGKKTTFEPLGKVGDVTQNIAKMIVGPQGGLLATGPQGVWICPDFKNTIQTCRGNLLGHRWEPASPIGLASSSKFSVVSAAIADGEHGMVWAMQPNGEIFCFPPMNRKFTTIQKPHNLKSMDKFNILSCSQDAVWAGTAGNEVYIRTGMGAHCPSGANWAKLDMEQLGDAKIVHISCGQQNVWAVDSKGFVYLRIGVKAPSSRLLNQAWVPVDGKPPGLGNLFTKVVTSPNDWMIWAIDSKKNVYVRNGVTENMPIGTKWILVPGTTAQQLTISDDTIWALSPAGEMLCRYGVSHANAIGDYWKKIPGVFSFISVSHQNKLWAISTSGQLYQHHAKHLIHSEHTASPESDSGWEVL